ncbi:MAG: OmpA family protein, partial [Schleiferiaceae bacterium]
FNTTSYTRESQLKLEALATAIKENPSEDIVIIGHTDEVGTDAYNYTLGLNRAQKVANFLVNTRGVAATRIEVRSEGLETPSSAGTPEMNRRVVVYLKN